MASAYGGPHSPFEEYDKLVRKSLNHPLPHPEERLALVLMLF